MSVFRFFLIHSSFILFFMADIYIVPSCNYPLKSCLLFNLLCLQGELEVVKEVPNKVITEKIENIEDQNTTEKLSDGRTKRDAFVTGTSKMPFLMLGLDLPPPPLFKDVMEKNIIPQVLLHFMLLYLLHLKCCSWYNLHWDVHTLKLGSCDLGCNCDIWEMYKITKIGKL